MTKLINKNGVKVEYQNIPDCWHVYTLLGEIAPGASVGEVLVADMVLDCWHQAHDYKAALLGEEQARLVADAEKEESRNIRVCKVIEQTLPAGCSLGYIGNVWTERGREIDDRLWTIFLPHPGRVGTSADRLGGFPTAERYKLEPLARGLSAGYNLARTSTEAAA